MGRNFWLALSFANLVYLRAWTDLIPVRSGDLFLRKALPGISLYFAVAGDVLALSGLTLLLIYLAPRFPIGCSAPFRSQPSRWWRSRSAQSPLQTVFCGPGCFCSCR
jgi:hypothetical protein